MSSELIFSILSGVAVLSAVLMVSSEKAASSAVFFTLTLFSISGIFLQLHSPLLFLAQIVAIVAILIALVLVAVDLSKFDLALLAEYFWRSKAAAIAVSFALLLEIILVILQHRLLPGENLLIFIPQNPSNAVLSLGAIVRFFFSHNLLPLSLLLFMALLVVTGILALFQRTAER